MDDTRAVFWIANKDPYLTEATNSARSVKRCMPDVTRVLFCPSWVVVFADDFDEVIDLPEPPHESWWTNSVYYLWKTSEILFYHGITEALYLDTDTYMCAPVYDLFRIMSYGDYTIAGAHAPGRITCKSEHDIPDCFPEINIGVNPMFTNDALKMWKLAYDQIVKNPNLNDQGALREAIWLNPDYMVYVLPPEYNMRLFPAFVSREVKILHGRSDEDYQSICNKVNASKGMRLWYKNQVLGE